MGSEALTLPLPLEDFPRSVLLPYQTELVTFAVLNKGKQRLLLCDRPTDTSTNRTSCLNAVCFTFRSIFFVPSFSPITPLPPTPAAHADGPTDIPDVRQKNDTRPLNYLILEPANTGIH